MTDELEDKVRAMLRRRAGDVSPSPDAWDAIETKVDETRRRTMTGQRWLAVAAAVVVVAGAAVAVVSSRPDRDTVRLGADGTTTTTPAVVLPADDRFAVPAVWPETAAMDLAQVAKDVESGSRAELRDPVETARTYLAERLDVPGDSLELVFREGDASSGEVGFDSSGVDGDGPDLSGIVLVRQVAEESMWVVMGATSETLDIRNLAYDGEQLTGEMAAIKGGNLDTYVEAVDGSDDLTAAAVKTSTGTHSLRHRLAGVAGVTIRLVMRDSDGIVGFAEARTDVPPTTAPGDAPVEKCSAAGAEIDVQPQPQLPAKVDALRTKLADLAATCDFDALEEIATSNSGDVGFTFTYGDAEQGPAAYWRDREAEGEPVMRRLLEVLSLRPTRQDPAPEIPEGEGPPVQWVWPAVSGTDRPTDADWNDLRRYYSDEEVDGARNQLGAWYGHRIGITLDGDWIYFVAGD